MGMVRKHFYFSGRVQGVGFRYQAVWAAQRIGLTGWVRNLYDGRVEMEVQGEEADLSRFLSDLQKDTFIRVEKLESSELPLEQGEKKFRTRFTG